MPEKSFSLEEHLKQEHRMSPIQTYLKEIVYGGNDGIVTTFAVVAGFAGAQSGNTVQFSIAAVMLFGLANLFADAASMALGSFLSLRSDQDLYKSARAKEKNEIKIHTDSEKEETIEILLSKGFSKDQAQKLTDIYSTNENYWVDFMMNHELQMPNSTQENPFLTGLATFFSFMIFGVIPLIPYLFLQQEKNVFFLSAIATFTALLLLGILRWKTTNENPLRSVGEIVFIGSVSAGIAYFVGTFFRL